MSELITPEEFINDKEFVKALKTINTELADLLKTFNALSTSVKGYYTEVNKGVKSNSEYIKNQNLAAKSTKEVTAAEKELERLRKDTEKTIAKKSVLSSQTYKDNVREREELKKQTEAKKKQEKQLKSEIDSLEGLRAKQQILREQRDKLKFSDKNYAANLRQVNAEIDANDKAIRKATDGEEKRQRNIGKYKEDIVKAYVAIQAALMVAKAAFNVVNDAIKENETTSEFLERKIGGLGAAYDVLKSKLFGFIEGLIKTDESSIKWGKGFKAFLSGISMGFSDLIPAVRRLGDEMDNAAAETEKLIKVQQELADLEGDRILERSIANRQLSEARDLYTQEGISLQEKKKYLKEAIALEQTQKNKELVYQTKILANLIVEGELKKKLKTYDVGREGLTIKQQEAKINDVISESLSAQRKAKANLKAIDDEIAKKDDIYAKQREMYVKGEQAMLAESEKEEEQRGIEAAKTMEAIDKAYYDARINADEETQKRLDANYKHDREQFIKEQEAKKKAIEEIKMLQIDAVGAVADLAFTIGDRNIANLEYQKQKELDAAGDNAKKKEKIEADYAKKIGKIKQKQAIADKGLSLLNILMSTRAAVMAIMAQLWVPFAVKTTQATWTRILGGLQAAAVIAAPIPKFFKGVKDFKGGLATVGEKGMELVETPKGSFLTPEKATTMLLPEHSTVHTHEKTIEKLKGMDSEKVNELINEQRLTRKAIANQTHRSTIITKDGFREETRKANANTIWIDKNFRT